MRKLAKLAMVLAVIAMSTQMAFAAHQNSTKVTGDLAKNGYLTINVDWMVDSAHYPGATNDVIRQKTREKIWEKVLPQLVKKAEGYPVSYDKSNFTKISENILLVKERPDGTTVKDVKIKVRFYCPRYAGTEKNVKKVNEKEADEELKYRFIRGI